MATGKRAFEGKTQASLIAKILETDPSTDLLPPADDDLRYDRVAKRCLEKEPDV